MKQPGAMFGEHVAHSLATSIAAHFRDPGRTLDAARASTHAPRTLIAGICGAQGSGKSTIAQALADLLETQHLRCAVLSLDDLYLPHAARVVLGHTVHPLLATRGVPGTHDVALGVATLASLSVPGEIPVPRFDKADDDPLPAAQWPRVVAPVDIVLFEGWCVGARPQTPEQLIAPINTLERDEDHDRRWRNYVNAALGAEYQRLFAPIELMIYLRAPSFDVVYGWRREQEEALRRALVENRRHAAHAMSDANLRRFVSYYERLTRWLLEDMPARADVTLQLAEDRSVRGMYELKP